MEQDQPKKIEQSKDQKPDIKTEDESEAMEIEPAEGQPSETTSVCEEGASKSPPEGHRERPIKTEEKSDIKMEQPPVVEAPPISEGNQAPIEPPHPHIAQHPEAPLPPQQAPLAPQPGEKFY